MARTQARKQRARIRQLEQALAAARTDPAPSLLPVPPREYSLAKAQEQRQVQRLMRITQPIYPSQIPYTDAWHTPDLYGAYQKGRLWSGYGSGMSFEILRLTGKRSLLNQALHSCCLHQLVPLSTPAPSPQDLGWRIAHKDAHHDKTDTDTPEIRARCARVQQIFQGPHPVHEPSFSNFLAKALNDHLTINRVAVELIRDRRGRIAQFRSIDGATILPTFRVVQRFIQQHQPPGPRRPEAYEIGSRILDEQTGMPISESEYVCVMRGDLVGTYMPGELLVWEFAPTTDIEELFAPSYVEKSVEGIVSWLNAFSYNRNYFTNGSNLDVILGLTGLEDDSFVEIAETLRENFSGLKGAHRLPVLSLPSKENVQVIKLKDNHREMQFDEWMTTLVSLVCAVYRVEPSRIYYAGRNHQGTAMFEHSKDRQIEASQEEGFRNNRAFFGEHFSALVRLIDPDLVFEWSGLEVEDRDAEMQIEVQEVTNFRSIDEIRQRHGDEPYNAPWSSVPLHALVFQASGQTAGADPAAATATAQHDDTRTPREARQQLRLVRNETAEDDDDAEDNESWPVTRRARATADPIEKARVWEEIQL